MTQRQCRLTPEELVADLDLAAQETTKYGRPRTEHKRALSPDAIAKALRKNTVSREQYATDPEYRHDMWEKAADYYESHAPEVLATYKTAYETNGVWRQQHSLLSSLLADML